MGPTQRVLMAALIGTAVIAWALAAALVWAVAPLLRAGALAAPLEMPIEVLAWASAASGTVLFVGVVVAWSTRRRQLGRAILLLGGLMTAMSGALLTNVALESGFSGTAATLGLVCGLLELVLGMFAWAASLSRWLPGQSPVARAGVRARGRTGLLVLTASIALGWLCCAVAVVTRFEMDSLGVLAWFVAVWGMPVLAGMAVGGWREVAPERMQSLGLAALTGMSLDLLYLLVLGLWYYRFNPIGFAPWWAIMGAILGASGFGLWQLLAGRGPTLRLHARS